MLDRHESQKRGQAIAKPSTRHPYAAIEHRVIDSPAYAALSYSARSVLILLTRQLSKDNNGQLQVSFTYCKKYGIGSEHTLRNAIAELIAHGFIYRTRSHGANGAWARYAVTWLPIKKRDGLFLDGFKPYAWRDWMQSQKKTSRQKVKDQSSSNCSFTPVNPAESAGTTLAESAEYELMPCRKVKEGVSKLLEEWKNTRAAKRNPNRKKLVRTGWRVTVEPNNRVTYVQVLN